MTKSAYIDHDICSMLSRVKCAAGPCDEPREPGRSFCPRHGPMLKEWTVVATVELTERHLSAANHYVLVGQVDGTYQPTYPTRLEIAHSRERSVDTSYLIGDTDDDLLFDPRILRPRRALRRCGSDVSSRREWHWSRLIEPRHARDRQTCARLLHRNLGVLALSGLLRDAQHRADLRP